MTSRSSNEGNKTNKEAKEQLWLVCPICKNANPSGTLHCKYCWGPSLYSVDPMTSEELAQFKTRLENRQKKLGLFRNLLIYVGAPILLVAGILFWLYNFTDVIFAPPAQMSSASLPGESSMYRYDLGRTGSTSLTAISPQGTLAWSFKTGDIIRSTPVVVGDTVYVGSNDHNMYALNAATGQVRWIFETGSWVQSSAAVVNGIVYFGSNDGKFYALDASTGYKLWDFDTKRTITSSPAVANGMVYFGSFDYNMYALDARTGAVIWKYQTGNYVMSSPVVTNGIIYFGSNDNSCYALNAVDGRFRLKVTHQAVFSSPSANGNDIYFDSQRYLVAMDGKARNWPLEKDIRAWWFRFYLAYLLPPTPPMTGLLWAIPISYYNTDTSPVYSEGSIYTTGDNRIYRVDEATRKITWTLSTNGRITDSPCLANDIVYIGSNDTKLYAIDAASGSAKWSFTTGGIISASPTYANGMIYVASEDGTLYALK